MNCKHKTSLVVLVVILLFYLVPADYKFILSAYWRDPVTVGEIAPLSNATAQYLTKYIISGSEQNAKHYLEVGAGYGAITYEIIKKLGPHDILDVIEIDDVMCKKLKDRFSSFAHVHVHCCSILDWDAPYQYDAIVSTLPFNSFDEEFARQVMQLYQKLALIQSCVVSYVEYSLLNKVVQYFFTKQGRTMYQDVQQYLRGVRQRHLLEEKVIYNNIPPVNVYHLKF